MCVCRQGYCDVFLKCRRVDAEGPLVQLKNLLFSEKTLMTIVEWVTVSVGRGRPMLTAARLLSGPGNNSYQYSQLVAA